MRTSRDGKTYYTTAEACQIAGTSKSTFLRWVKEGSFADVDNWNHKGWRLFTEEDVGRLEAKVNMPYEKPMPQNFCNRSPQSNVI